MDSIIDYVNCNIEDFKNGVDSKYIEDKMASNKHSAQGIKVKLNVICNVVRKRINGNKTRIYTLKDDYEDIIKQYIKTNPEQEDKQEIKQKDKTKDKQEEEEELPHIYYRLRGGRYIILA